jgi:hypothetical protein
MRIRLVISLSLLLLSANVMAQGGNAKASSQQNPPAAKLRTTRFFPTPATSVINFEISRPSAETYGLRLFNFLGKKVLELPRVSNTTRIDLTGFTRGIYIFQILDASGKVIESGKFSVEK